MFFQIANTVHLSLPLYWMEVTINMISFQTLQKCLLFYETLDFKMNCQFILNPALEITRNKGIP